MAEAGRVSEQAVARAEQTAVKERLAIAEHDLARTEAKSPPLADWQRPGGKSVSCRACRLRLRRWLDDWQRLRQAAEECQHLADEHTARAEVCTRAASDLRSALELCGGLPPSVGPAASWPICWKSPSNVSPRRRSLAARPVTSKPRLSGSERSVTVCAALEQAERLWKQWQEDWAEAVGLLELEQDTLPNEANRILDTLLEFWRKIGDVKQLSKRIDSMEEHTEQFRREVAGAGRGWREAPGRTIPSRS